MDGKIKLMMGLIRILRLERSRYKEVSLHGIVRLLMNIIRYI